MLHLYENLRTISYAPFYIAETLTLFETHGVEVEMTLSASPKETALGLLEGRMDVAFGGPMRVMMHHDQDPTCPLVCFCKFQKSLEKNHHSLPSTLEVHCIVAKNLSGDYHHPNVDVLPPFYLRNH